MKLATAFETVPGDDDLLYSIEHWSKKGIEESDGRFTDSLREAFVHPRTGTAARIIEDEDGTYSVQPSMGDFGPYGLVVQSDDPTEFVSGGASVAVTGLESKAEARAVAHFWMRGWVMRNSTVGDSEGDVLDSESERTPAATN